MNTYVINDKVTNELWFSEDAAQAVLNVTLFFDNVLSFDSQRSLQKVKLLEDC